MKLEGQTVKLDLSNLYLSQLDQILGILSDTIKSNIVNYKEQADEPLHLDKSNELD